MMHEREKSDPAVVAVEAGEQRGSESAERSSKAGAKGNAEQHRHVPGSVPG